MFGISFGELVVIALLGLVLFGPEKLPELARSLGKFMAGLNRTMESVQRDYKEGLQAAERLADEDPPATAMPNSANSTASPNDDTGSAV